MTGDFSLLRDLASVLPLIVKPSRAQRGSGPVVVRCRSDLSAMPAPTQPMIVQPLIPGTDLKVYVVGDQVFALRKRLSGRNFRSVCVPCNVSPEVRDIALRCGRVFGLGLYGLDIIESSGGPVVVDLDYSPGYRGVPEIAPLIARYIEQFACDMVTAGGSETPAHCAEPAPADPVAEPA